MIILLSPAKSLDMENPAPIQRNQQPRLLDHSKKLVEQLRGMEESQMQDLMSISEKIAQLNVERYQQWSLPFNEDNAKAAIFAFQGDVYKGFESENLDLESLERAEKQVRILSGLYGVLRPFDLMQAYRLEMGTSLENEAGKDLYAFWGSEITQVLNADIEEGKHEFVLNLASQEYFKSVNYQEIIAPIISPAFKDEKNGKFKIISFYAKHARGAMARAIVQKNIQTLDELRSLEFNGYRFNEDFTKKESEPVFTRTEEVLAELKA